MFVFLLGFLLSTFWLIWVNIGGSGCGDEGIMLIWIKLWVARNFAKALFENSLGQLTLQWPLQPTGRSTHMITNPVLFPPGWTPTTWSRRLTGNFSSKEISPAASPSFPNKSSPCFLANPPLLELNTKHGGAHQTWKPPKMGEMDISYIVYFIEVTERMSNLMNFAYLLKLQHIRKFIEGPCSFRSYS